MANTTGYLSDDWWQQCRDEGLVLDPPRSMEPMVLFRKRIGSFKRWLQERPEQNICLVCHAVVIHALTGKWVRNCEVNMTII